LYENLYYEEHDLQVPHPGLPDRRFVLTPLSEIASRVSDPFSGTTVEKLLAACADKCSVKKTDIVISAKPNP
jgi:2-amino-4-hydroxy-6-hydroxymethyldihydropteridine diphosphokinase